MSARRRTKAVPGPRIPLTAILAIAVVATVGMIVARPRDPLAETIATIAQSRPTVAAVQIPAHTVKGITDVERIFVAPGQIIDPTLVFAAGPRAIQIGATILVRQTPRVDWVDIEHRGAVLLVLPRPVTTPVDTRDIAVRHRTVYINTDQTVSTIVPSGVEPPRTLREYRFALVATDSRPMAEEIEVGDRFEGPSNLPDAEVVPSPPIGTPIVVTAVPPGAYPAPTRAPVTVVPTGPYPSPRG